ncbi:MAG: hypothetical protein WCI51_20055 [Lentisphaerota bacterium]
MKILWDGQITARDVSGNKQDYKYDLKGQLLAVVDATGKAVEQYVYDAAGNILSKAIDGKVTTFKYDKANQLVSSNNAVSRTDYEYDAAGRLTKEGSKEYAYGWLDKVVNVSENGKLTASYDYGVDGQISGRTDATGKSENFTWDGLALIKRDSTNFVNESAVTGGNPILAFDKDSSKVLFEDMLGSSVGSVENGKFNAIDRSAFGESKSDSELNFFTGKPQVEGLGYAFQLRNYRADQGKWQTSDLKGYPDGWNNLAYVNNKVTMAIDWRGAETVELNDPGNTVFTVAYGQECNWEVDFVTVLGVNYTILILDYDYQLQGKTTWQVVNCGGNNCVGHGGGTTTGLTINGPLEIVEQDTGWLTSNQIAEIHSNLSLAAAALVKWSADNSGGPTHQILIVEKCE